MPARSEAEWRQWLMRIDAREPHKARYRNFYQALDRDVPSWISIIKAPAFLEWGTTRDQETGSCFFDMMFECWDNPTWQAGQFATFLRLFIQDTGWSATARPRVANALGRLMGRVLDGPQSTHQRHLLSGRYEIIRRLGGGGNGNVYLVWSRETGSLYGLKVIRSEMWHDSQVINRFKREIEIWVDLGVHPNIVTANFLDIKDDVLYMTMEYVEGDEGGGPSLEEKVRHRPIDDADVAKWFVQIADGLDHAYSCGVQAHRDIKPGNILITRDGTAKVSDFGLAYPLLGGGPVDAGRFPKKWTETVPGRLLGTPLYMAPEQFSDASVCDQRSDIYSLGITFYQVVAGGNLPFFPRLPADPRPADVQRFFHEIRAMHEEARPTRLRSQFWPVIEKCLSKRPDRRFAKASEFREAMREIARAKGVHVLAKAIVETDIWAYRDKGNTLLRLGRYEEAIAAFDRFLQEIPDDTVLFNKAVSLENLGRTEEALELYERLCRQDDYKAFVNAAECYRKLGQHAKALGSAARATELNPNDESSWVALGNIQFTLARKRLREGEEAHSRELFIDAAMTYRRAVSIAPLSPTPLFNLALASKEAGDLDGAAQPLVRFLELCNPLDTRRDVAQKILEEIRGCV